MINNSIQYKKRQYDPSRQSDDRRPHSNGRQHIGTGMSSLSRVKELATPDVIRRPPQPQPEPLVFTGKTDAWYKTVRNGQTKRVYLVEVKKDEVKVKDDPNDKHSTSMSLAKFMKFFTAE